MCLFIPVSTAVNANAWDTQYRQIEQRIKQPEFANRVVYITKYGASPKAKAQVNQSAINKAIDICSRAGGGRVIVPAGLYNTGAITMKSKVNLVVDKGATLLFVFQPELYPVVPTRWEGLDCWNLSPCIYAYKVKDVAITGEGTIDGGGTNDTWWKWCGAEKFGWKPGTISQRNGSRAQLQKYAEDGISFDKRKFGSKDGLRPQLINFNQCENILIENVTLLRSPFWVIHPLLSKNITVRGVHINNDGPNGDGCDPESCDNVLIENCYFHTGDDCIAIKSGRNNDGRIWDRPSENIIIRNCKMADGHGGIVIGSEITGGCRNVFAENNEMDSPELERVIRIKTNTCRGGIIENIFARNIKVGQCKEAVLKINLDYEHNEICCRGYVPTVRNVNIENITCEKSQYGVMVVALDTTTNVYDINVKNCKWNGVSEGNSIVGKTRNINFDNLFINGSMSLMDNPYKNYSQWMTMSEMKREPKSYLLDFSKSPKWSYVMGIELEAMLDTYLKYGGDDIRNYCREYTDTMINDKGEIRGYNLKDYNLDQIRTGHFVARMYQQFPEKKNLIALETLMEQLKKQPRTNDGVYWHKAIYAYQVWLDGIFMGLPYYTLTANMLLKPKQATKIFDDAVNQISKTYDRTYDAKTGLNRHAWDETNKQFWADKQNGQSQHCWGRAQGWYSMALIELLDAIPQNYARRAELIELLRKDLDGVIRWQDKKSGVWYQVMDTPDGKGNYLESTCSSMFAYVLLKAYRKGYLGSKYRDAGIRAYRGIINKFIKINGDSTISLTNCCAVAGLGPGEGPYVKKPNYKRDGSYSYYLSEPIRDNDAKGLGPFIWASLEMEALGYNSDNVMTSINRQAVVSRNNPILTHADTLASLTVGNGHFATTVDITGLQSYPSEYANGIPLCSMSDWGWHTFKNTDKLKTAEMMKAYDFGRGHLESYATEYKQGGRQQAATNYFRINPHRINLGYVGLQLKDKAGNIIPLNKLDSIRQEQDLWDGKIESQLMADGKKVKVSTACSQNKDQLLTRIESTLLKNQQATVTLRFPYPTGKHADDASDWNNANAHQSVIISQNEHTALIERTLDTTKYYVNVEWEGNAKITETDKHEFTLTTTDDLLTVGITYTEKLPEKDKAFEYNQALKAVMKAWSKWWNRGAIVDFSGCTDPRAKELERRVVLSQYLTQINCANNMPPQETGLTYNTWYGRPHLEMTWWHATDFALWNHPENLGNILSWYTDVAYPAAVNIARRQGFKGARWMKMTDPQGGEAPSNTGSFLIWQQPHFIYLAEEMYRAHPSAETLKKYSKQVEATAEFMADFACYDKNLKQYLLPGSTAMQESMSKDFSYRHPFEIAYWRYGLRTAQLWRERAGLVRNADWDKIINGMNQLVEQNGIYTAGAPKMAFDNNHATKSFDPFITPDQDGNANISEAEFAFKSRSDHPAVLGVCGLLPTDSVLYDRTKMTTTLNWVMNNWNWNTTWGWDYGMVAMAAARLNQPETALQAILIDKQKNTYLANGHNFQEPKRLRLYLPGNGALLTTVAMMCAGWDGCQEPNNPGFPKDGKWNVRWEGLQRMQ